MGQVNACEEHDSAQYSGETETFSEHGDARNHAGERDQVLVDQDPVGTNAAYAPQTSPLIARRMRAAKLAVKRDAVA
jgi:hypothetical protein